MKNIKLYSKLACIMLASSLSITSLSGCSIMKNHESKLESLEEYPESETLDMINNMSFTNESFRLAYYNFMLDNENADNSNDIDELVLDNVDDLSDIKLFDNVTNLRITNSENIDLSPLKGTSITCVSVENSSVYLGDSINKSMIYIGLSNCDVKDVANFSNYPNLEYLNLSFTNYDNLDFIKDNSKLTNIYLCNNYIRDFSALKNRKLSYLGIVCTQVDDWSFVSDIKSIERVNFNLTNFNDISLLANVDGIKYLDLSYTLIEDLDGIEKLDKLSDLNISSCQRLKSYDDLANLNKIINLYACNLETIYSDDVAPYYATSNINDDEEVLNQVIDIYNSLGITDSMSDEEKVKLITIKVIDSIEYDYENLNKDNTAFCNQEELVSSMSGKGICSSYAGLESALLKMAGIDNYLISGVTVLDDFSTLHRWLIVNVDGEWVGIDPTFLDGMDAVGLLKANLNVYKYYLADLGGRDWCDTHYAFYMPDLGEEYTYNLVK